MNQAGVAAIALLLIAATAAWSAEAVRPEEVANPVAWGSASKVTRIRRLWIADQPDEAGLRQARESAVSVVINLREPSELSWDERTVVESLGMTYYNVPVAREAPLSSEQMAEIEEIVQRHGGQQVLIHCSTANRAAAWLATHLVHEHAMALDDALTVARQAGLTKADAEAKVRSLLGSTAATPTP